MGLFPVLKKLIIAIKEVRINEGNPLSKVNH